MESSCVCPRSRNWPPPFDRAPSIKPSQNVSKGPSVAPPLHHLPCQSTQTMSSNPYAPNLPSDVIWLEHAAFAGNNIGEIFYGAHLHSSLNPITADISYPPPTRNGHLLVLPDYLRPCESLPSQGPRHQMGFSGIYDDHVWPGNDFHRHEHQGSAAVLHR